MSQLSANFYLIILPLYIQIVLQIVFCQFLVTTWFSMENLLLTFGLTLENRDLATFLLHCFQVLKTPISQFNTSFFICLFVFVLVARGMQIVI